MHKSIVNFVFFLINFNKHIFDIIILIMYFILIFILYITRYVYDIIFFTRVLILKVVILAVILKFLLFLVN